MDFQQLSSLIKVDGNVFRLAKGQLGSAVDPVITSIGAGNTIEVAGSPNVASDQATERVIVSGGRLSFLNRQDLPVRFLFSVDEKDQAQVLVEFQLRGASPTPQDWKFSNSFPELPKVFSYRDLFGGDEDGAASDGEGGLNPSPLDELDLFDTYFVVTSFATTQYALPKSNIDNVVASAATALSGDIALKAGLNFVSRMRTSNVLGLLASTLGADDVLTLSGPIKQYFSTTVQTPLNTAIEEMPWEAAAKLGKPVVGINLQAKLGISPISLTDTLSFSPLLLRIYSPPSAQFLKTNRTFTAKLAFTGKLNTADGNIDADITAIVPPQSEELAIVGVFNIHTVNGKASVDGLSIGNIENLTQLAGPSNLAGNMPEQLQSDLDAVRLKRAAIYVSGTLPKLSVDAVSATIGLPDDQTWTVWQGTGSGPPNIEVGGLASRFEVRTPFSNPSLNVTVTGVVNVEGVGFQISANSSNDYSLQTMLTDKQSIPLNRLMKTYAPGVPAPDDLTINALRMTIGLKSPDQYYSMSALFASDPKWNIPIGPTTLQISNVNLNFRYDRNPGALSGSFGGQLKFGDIATVSMRYILPGDLTVRAVFPELKLTQLIDELSDPRVGLKLPSDFDFNLTNSYVLLEKGQNDYILTLGTEVSDFGLLAFTAYRKDSAWGFAVGLNLQDGGISKIPALGGLLDQFAKFVGLSQLMLVVSSSDNPGFTFPAMAQFNAPNLSGDLPLPASANGLSKGLNLYASFAFNQSNNRGLSTLLKYLSLDKLDLGIIVSVSIPDPLENSKLFISASGTAADNSADDDKSAVDHRGQLNEVTTFSVQLGVGVQTDRTTLSFWPGTLTRKLLEIQ